MNRNTSAVATLRRYCRAAVHLALALAVILGGVRSWRIGRLTPDSLEFLLIPLSVAILTGIVLWVADDPPAPEGLLEPWEGVLEEDRFSKPDQPFGSAPRPDHRGEHGEFLSHLHLVRQFRKPLNGRYRVFSDPKYLKNDRANQ